jgi:hypothetical protein
MTEEQKAKLKVLEKKCFWRGVRRGCKYALLFFITTVMSLALNCILFQPPNLILAIILGLINGAFLGKMIRSDFVKTKKQIEEDVRKVFEE